MAATVKEVQNWIKEGKKQGATHIISVCDTFNYDDYPVYVLNANKLEEQKRQYNGSNMQKINEVIDLSHYTNAGILNKRHK